MRPTPFEMVFAPLADRFPLIRAELLAAGAALTDRDAFLLSREGVSLLRELRPEEGLGDAIDELVAFTQAAFLFWVAGSPTFRLSQAELRQLLQARPPTPAAHHGPLTACYIQTPERLIWAEVIEGQAAEPLDGTFLNEEAGTLRVVGTFGLHPGRSALSVVEVSGPRVGQGVRGDGSAPFAPLLPGGVQAGLYSIAGPGELLELAWRARDRFVPTVPDAAGPAMGRSE